MANKNRKRHNSARLNRKRAAEISANANDSRFEVSSDQRNRNKLAAALSGGYDFADTLHNIYIDYGYPSSLEFNNFWNMYRRFGIATRTVQLPVDVTWRSNPTVVGADQFDRELDQIVQKVKLWKKIKALDTRQRVGRYAGLFMRVRDGLTPDQPIEQSSLSGVASLVDVTPLYESQLEIIETDTDPSSDNFGQPKLIQYNQSLPGDRNEETNNTINIHASRIVFASEGADDGWIYGVPVLEPIYNSLMDLRKIIGGGAEGFYKNAAQSVVFDLKDPSSATQYEKQLNDFSESFDDFSKNRSRRAMWTPGMDAHSLDSSLITPEQFFNVALNDVAAGSGIPATILIGQQTGRLASDEDSAQFLSDIQSRRENYGKDLISSVIDWFVTYGILPASEYEVEWDDLLARSDNEKLDNANKMSEINKNQFSSGGSPAFTSDEIREAVDYELNVDINPGTELLPGDEED